MSDESPEQDTRTPTERKCAGVINLIVDIRMKHPSLTFEQAARVVELSLMAQWKDRLADIAVSLDGLNTDGILTYEQNG